jgi:exopolyphosphatase / guanosine-5'-triphosphate,3'-diphosphate pyrophosphatase
MGHVLSAVDIGSNTVHLLVADTDEGSISRVADQNEWLNLGEIVANEGEIPLPLQDELIQTLIAYRALAKTEKAERFYIFATEAMRVAKNSARVIKRIKVEVGVEVDLVTGQQEADLCLAGVLVDCDGADEMIVAEVGGGSAQVAFAREGVLIDDASLPLGTGTLSARFAISYPCREEKVDELRSAIRKELSKAVPHLPVEQVTASGGVARGIWRALHADSEREIASPELDYIIWSTQRLTLEQIQARFRVKARRAATLLPGAIMYQEILRRYKKEKMLVSRYGVREGAILQMAAGRIKGCPL